MSSSFDRQKCRLCSSLSSAFSGLFFRLFGSLCCRWINRRTSARNFPDRVGAINSCAPMCACEKVKASPHSCGPVTDDEIITRFIFSPMHFRNGKVLPSLFSHAEKKGCSIQRELAQNEEISAFVGDFLRTVNHSEWLGVVSAPAGDIRRMRVDGVVGRAICVYDTAEPHNPAHGEMCWSGAAMEEGDAQELRKMLMDAFRASSPTKPSAYRNGAISDLS